MDLGLNGKIALVTGAGSGVGREIARSLAAEGAIVAVNYRTSATDTATLVAEIAAKGGKAKPYRADVAVSLGLVETDHDKAWVEANREKLVPLYPLRRLGLASDVGPMVAMLASPRSAWITGQVLSISGGYSMV